MKQIISFVKKTWLSATLSVAMLAAVASPILSAPSVALALETGTTNGSTFSNVDAGGNTPIWSSVSNAQTSNGSYATVTLNRSNNRDSDYLYSTGFGFSIPNGSTINGIQVTVERSAATAGRLRTDVVRLIKNGTLAGNNLGNDDTYDWTTSDVVETYGGATSLWGTTWTAADLNAANTGIAVAARHSSSGSGNISTLGRIDHVTMKVWYTEPVPPPTPGANPDLGESCGLDIALVLDSSGSIDGTELNTMKDAFEAFVDAFLPATPTEFTVIDFDDNSTVVQDWSSDAATVKTGINVPTSGGGTDWEAGLIEAHEQFANRSNPDLIVFASDGNPTEPGSDTEALHAAIEAANDIKADGIRIITLGIGGGLNTANLEDISSADAVYTAANFDDIQAELQAIAGELCGGTITVKKVIDADGNLETTGDQTPGEGWNFTVAGESETTDASGFTTPVEVDEGTGYSVIEDLDPNFSLISASCSAGENDPRGTFDQVTGVTGIDVGSADIVSCTFYNSPLPGTLTVTKDVTNDDGGDSDPEDFEITVTVNDQKFETFQGSASGTVVIIPAGANFSVSEDNGNYVPNFEGTCSGTMTSGADFTCEITNDDPEPTTGYITVIKNVINDNGGDATAESFTLQVSYTENESPVTIGVASGIALEVAPGTYTVSELPALGYSGTIGTGEGDDCGSDGVIVVEAGSSYTCTITNDDVPATITVVKNLINDNGAQSTPSNFSFQVNGGEPNTFENDGTNVIAVTPGQSYSITEVDAPGYTTSYDNCSGINVGFAGNVTCTITNDDVPPPTPACSDKADNDEDGLTDAQDPDCHTDGDPNDEDDSYDPNDNDESSPSPTPGNTACSNGEDDDEDGLIDMKDPGCDSPEDDREHNSSRGGGGGGGSVLGASTGPQPQVLGESCGMYITTFIKLGNQNDAADVMRLQTFLNENMGSSLPVTGFFGELTMNVLKAFQVKYKDEVLTPWANYGLTPDEAANGTGYVYKTTQRWINMLKCAELNLPVPQLP